MRKQQSIWQAEHQSGSSLPSLAETEPSSAVKYFTEFLESKNITSGKVIDIGCGKGRNSIFLAKQGFEVWAIDYIKEALSVAESLAKRRNIQNKIHLINSAIDELWPFEDNFFDAAVDCFSSIDIETAEGREVYKNEMKRTLKAGGVALVSVVSVEDEMEKEQTKGLEKNSTIWPNGKFQKNYDEQELRDFYSDFEILEIKEVKKPAFKLGNNYTASNFWVILENH